MKKYLSILILLIVVGCLSMPKKKYSFNINQEEPFQKCQILAIINECYVLVKVKDKMYVSKLAGISFDRSDFHPSWTKEQIRQLKICFLDSDIRWRGDNYHLFFLDVSPNKNISEIILVGHDLNGFSNLHNLFLNGGAGFEVNYKGPYAENMKENYLDAKNRRTGLFGEYDKDLLDRFTPKGFDLKNFPEGEPTVLGEWVPTEAQLKEINVKGVKSSE